MGDPVIECLSSETRRRMVMAKKDWHVKFSERVVQEMTESYRGWIEFSFERSAKLCESPIETAMLYGLRWLIDPEPVWHDADVVCYQKPYERWPEFPSPFNEVVIMPQATVGPYRADFLIGVHRQNRGFWVVVECDGHDFHEKTKEQARRDKERDRFMVSAGIFVLRYSGQEIFEDAEGCAMQVSEFISNKCREVLDGGA